MSTPVYYLTPPAPRLGAYADTVTATNLDTEVTLQEVVLWDAKECDRKGWRFKWRAQVNVTGRNGADTHRVRVYAVATGGTPVALADSGAAAAAAGTSITLEGELHLVTLGAAGTARAIGSSWNRLSGATAIVAGTLNDVTNISSILETKLRVTVLASDASAGNVALCTDIQAHTLPSQEGI